MKTFKMPISKSDQPIALDRAHLGSRLHRSRCQSSVLGELEIPGLPSTARTLFSGLRVSTHGKQAGPLVGFYHSAGRQPANSTPRPAGGTFKKKNKKKTRKHLSQQAKKAMNILYQRIYNLDLPLDICLKLFDQTITPILTYSSETEGYENTDIIEKIHTEFLRKITKLKEKHTPVYALCRIGKVQN